jgi:hypothetical protein
MEAVSWVGVVWCTWERQWVDRGEVHHLSLMVLHILLRPLLSHPRSSAAGTPLKYPPFPGRAAWLPRTATFPIPMPASPYSFGTIETQSWGPVAMLRPDRHPTGPG